jgi:hypothetical protein
VKIEILVGKAELTSLLESVKDDAELSVERCMVDDLQVNFKPVSISKAAFADLVAQDLDLNMTKISVESMQLLPDGSVGLVLLKKVV